jgi:nitrite reductase/ring-hydroxylating ferredoxin subunit
MKNRDLPFDPDGWYCLALSRDVMAGQLLVKRFAGRDVILFRGASGAVAVTEAYCPHLGAHFGYGGTVEGDSLRCPFHGFCFDREGTCVKVAPAYEALPKAKLSVLHAIERNGFVFAWHSGEGREPWFDIPALDPTGFRDLRTTTWQLRAHPQETTENSVDVGHLSVVHGYEKVAELSPLRTEGPYLYAHYTMSRSAGVFGRSDLLRAEFEIHVHGLGYSFVDVRVPEYGLHTRHFVLNTPMDDDGQCELRVAISMESIESASKINPALSLLPSFVVNELIERATFRGFCHDVQQDFEIWQHKIYLQPPGLAKGDGPVGPYRRWARQFYPDLRADLVSD